MSSSDTVFGIFVERIGLMPQITSTSGTPSNDVSSSDVRNIALIALLILPFALAVILLLLIIVGAIYYMRRKKSKVEIYQPTQQIEIQNKKYELEQT
jgi:NADH:ubiquinone oxidoreductase subunit 6 (subunit J)